MNQEKYEQLLEKIHAEAEKSGQIDEKGRKLLEELERDIRSLLARSGPRAESPTVQRIRDAITHFEVTHPALTAMLAELSTILGNAGI